MRSRGAIGTYGSAAALSPIGCRALSRMGRSDDYRRYAKECLDMASTVQEAKARASLLQMAQVSLGPGTRRQDEIRSRRRVRAFGLPGELVPSLGHFLQDPAVLLGFCLLCQAVAFLREALVFG